MYKNLIHVIYQCCLRSWEKHDSQKISWIFAVGQDDWKQTPLVKWWLFHKFSTSQGKAEHKNTTFNQIQDLWWEYKTPPHLGFASANLLRKMRILPFCFGQIIFCFGTQVFPFGIFEEIQIPLKTNSSPSPWKIMSSRSPCTSNWDPKKRNFEHRHSESKPHRKPNSWIRGPFSHQGTVMTR